MDPAFEQRLIRRAASGDRGAFERLYREHAPSLLRLVIRPRLADPSMAEDVLVETFTAAWRKLGSFECQGKGLFAWLARIATNKCHDTSRRGARRAGYESAAAGESSGGHPDVERPIVAHLDRVRVRRRIDAVLAEVNPRYAKALELRLLDGRPRMDCAERLGVKLGTFDVLLLRAVRAFRKRWEQRFGSFDLSEVGHG